MTVMVELAQPRKLRPRWLGHGDVLLVIDGAYTYVGADDLERLAGLPAWGDGETVLGDEWPLDIDGVHLYTLDDAVAKCARHGSAAAVEFTSWLEKFLAGVDDAILEHAHQPIGFTAAMPVATAARHLTADTGIRLGRDRLFEILDELDWIGRSSPAHDWVITQHAWVRDLLTLRAVSVGASTKERSRRYLQVHVTPAGLDALRTHLSAPADAQRLNAPPPHPPLF